MVFYNIFVTRIRGSVSRYGSGSRKPESIRIRIRSTISTRKLLSITFIRIITFQSLVSTFVMDSI